MVNIEMDRAGDVLTIKVDLSREIGRSKTGKTMMIASTQGNVIVPGEEGAKLGLNVYKPIAV